MTESSTSNEHEEQQHYRVCEWRTFGERLAADCVCRDGGGRLGVGRRAYPNGDPINR